MVSLKEARAAAFENARAVAAGNGLVQQPDERVPTLREAAEKTVEILRPRWTDPRHPRLWLRSLELYVISALGAHRVSDFRSRELLEVLVPLFERTPDTCGRVRRRVRAVMNRAIAQGYRTDNPAAVVLSTMLPAGASRPLHFRTLPHAKVGDALATIRPSGAHPSTKLALELLVLTATRSGEIRGVRWSGFDLDGAVWTLPEERMKMREAFRAPLSRRACAVFAEARDFAPAGDLVFPSARGRVISDMTLSKLLPTTNIPCVPHGFRSSFRDWCAESQVSRQVAEACLAHQLGGQGRDGVLAN